MTRNKMMDTMEKNQEALSEMLDHILISPAVFKSQQIDDPEMSKEEKRKIAEEVLFENPVAFLTRFGTYLTEKHLAIFHTFQNPTNKYDLEFHLGQIRSSLNSNKRMKIIRNRRFEALKRLQHNGKYFSEGEMESREPLLYHQLVGQYLSESEKSLRKAPADASENRMLLSDILIRTAEKEELEKLRLRQEEEENAESISSDEESSHGNFVPPARWGADWEDEEADTSQRKQPKRVTKKQISSEEKSLLLQEFRTCMFTKFMDGLDSEFDYSAVDTNSEYDCLQIRSQDEEEKYFDEESCEYSSCTDTGIEDY